MALWWVTGASRGLGAALVDELAARGHRLLACARDGDALRVRAARDPGRITACPIDLADGDGLQARAAALIAEHGVPDGVLHNAGIGWYRPFLQHDEASLRAIIQVNLTAVIQLSHAVLPGMLARGSGQIYAIGSDLGRRPLANMAAYVASKHGLVGFMHSLLREVKDRGIRVGLVNPGMIDTGFGDHAPGQHADGSVLRPQALAKLVVQLVEQPDDLLVDEISVHPPRQADF